jgi:hypothetical protein
MLRYPGDVDKAQLRANPVYGCLPLGSCSPISELRQPIQEIVFKGRRITWIERAGSSPGEVGEGAHRPELANVPGFDEVCKRIESLHLTWHGWR